MTVIQHDDFLPNFDDLKQYAQDAVFEDVKNPYDGVVYPLICKDIPKAIDETIRQSLAQYLNREPEVSAMFMRRSPEGVKVPHVAHTDASMGDYSLMLYMDGEQGAGTAFLRHKASGITYQPEDEKFVQVAAEDQNDLRKWVLTSMVAAKPNRAAIFDAGLFHCAMPVGGYGEGADGRTVLTVFFS